LANYKIRSNTD